jgi:hypothetical protein
VPELLKLYAAGLSRDDIATSMGLSRGTVCGKLDRLVGAGILVPRAPVAGRRGGPAATPEAEAQRRARIGHGVSATAERHRVQSGKPPRPAKISAAPQPAAVCATSGATAPTGPTPIAVGSAARPARVIDCCWPIGEPGTRGFRFCDADSLPGRQYCAAHAALAYGRREAA